MILLHESVDVRRETPGEGRHEGAMEHIITIASLRCRRRYVHRAKGWGLSHGT